MASFQSQLQDLIARWRENGGDPAEMADVLRTEAEELTPKAQEE